MPYLPVLILFKDFNGRLISFIFLWDCKYLRLKPVMSAAVEGCGYWAARAL